MTKCELRACCRRPLGAVISTEERPRTTLRSGEAAPVLQVVEELKPPEESIAHHEAGHAVFLHMAGVAINDLTIAGQPEVNASTRALTLPECIAMYLAGPAAENAAQGWRITLHERQLDEYWARLDDFSFGSCDCCQAALNATVHANRCRTNRADVFREGERRAIDFVREPRVRLAIRALARALMEKHTLSGAEAHAIISKHIEFGELKNAEDNQEVA